ncbi:MAG: hypothetical protein MJZ81_11485 [Bacteroidales bacterium]|nr:hypothetical protein [Bacteroidales bacterium]
MHEVETMVLHSVGLVLEQAEEVLSDLEEITDDTTMKCELVFMSELLNLVTHSIHQLTNTPDDSDEI